MRIFYFFLQNRECKYESKLAVQSNISNYPIKQYGYIKHTNQAHPLKKIKFLTEVCQTINLSFALQWNSLIVWSLNAKSNWFH